MDRLPSGTAAALAAVLLLAGCGTYGGKELLLGDGTSGQHPAVGRVTGWLLIDGGPVKLTGPHAGQARPRPVRGEVTFTAAGHRRVKVKVGRSGDFSVTLPPARYRVSGRSPAVITVSNGAVIGANGRLIRGTEWESRCSAPLSVTVTAHHTVHAAVTCYVP